MDPAIVAVAITGSAPGQTHHPAVPVAPVESRHEAREGGARHGRRLTR